jgi:hypothetical protein
LVGEIPADFMLRVLQFVLVDFQRFPKPVGSSTQHECDMDLLRRRIVSRGIHTGTQPNGVTMTVSSTRRAILAGAARLPALSLPAIASDDSEVLALGAELRRVIAAEIELKKVYDKASAPHDRIVRKLVKRGLTHADAHFLAIEVTPQGRVRSDAYDKWDAVASKSHELSERIIRFRPTTCRGLAEVVFAALWDHQQNCLEMDFTLCHTFQAVAAAGGFELPNDLQVATEEEIKRVDAIPADA